MEELDKFVSKDIWEIISSQDEPLEKLQKIVEKASDFLMVGKASLMLKDKSGFFKIVASEGVKKKVIKETKIKGGEGTAGQAIQEKKVIFMKKIGKAPGNEERGYKTDSFISHPIAINGEIIGVFNLTDKRNDMDLNEDDLRALSPLIERMRFVIKDLK